MIAEGKIWSILQGHMPRERWVSAQDIYAIVELYGNLNDDDKRPRTSLSKTPKWKTLVRDVLVKRLKNGKLRWRRGSGQPNGVIR